jgi:hypothetical protein
MGVLFYHFFHGYLYYQLPEFQLVTKNISMRKYFLFLSVIILVNCNNQSTERKPGICLSFDDKTIHEWFELRTLFKDNDAKVTFFITQPDSLTATEIEQLKILQQDGHEIGFHGNMHVVSEYYIKEHSYKIYMQNEIENGLTTMDALGFKCASFAYPYGATYWFTDYMLLKKFQHLRKVSPLNKTRDLSKLVNAYYAFDGNRTHHAVGIDYKTGITKEMIDAALERTIRNKEVFMLYGHAPSIKDDASEYSFDIELLQYILETANAKGLHFYRFEDL